MTKPNSQVLYLPRGKIRAAAQKYETPFFIYEEKRLRQNCRRFTQAFQKYLQMLFL